MSLELTLKREPSNEVCTHGKIYVGSVCLWESLEDVVRPEKIAGKTAIPAGRYRVVINYSPKFKKDLPLLIGVPNFSGIRIHAGNDSEDTEGCILMGTERAGDTVLNSRVALAEIMGDIQEALDHGEQVWITIEGP